MTEKTPGKRPRRTFSPEYKHEAARLVIDTGRTIAGPGLPRPRRG
ncbi:hypothetical protein [Corynebacterium sputi]|nr:hypothetical protein [Corynebacterium sputi]